MDDEPIDEPVEETPAEEPTEDFVDDAPVDDVVEDEPVEDIAGEELVDEFTGDEPVESLAGEGSEGVARSMSEGNVDAIEPVDEEELAIRDRIRSLVLAFLAGEAKRPLIDRHANCLDSPAEEVLVSGLFKVRRLLWVTPYRPQ